MKYIKLFTIVFILWLAAPQAFTQAVNVQDSLALVEFYDSTNGPGWNNNFEWKNGPVSNWHGITVSGGRVTQLSLIENNLIGSIPESFGNLTNLQTLLLSYNQLGSLPESFGNLTNLTAITLDGNQLSSLPESFGNLTNLMGLSLSSNQLSSLPEFFGNLTNLHRLNLGLNQLGTLPEYFGNFINLEELYLYENQLSSLPVSFGNLMNLQVIFLGYNQLNSLPESFANLTNLQVLYLPKNQLSSLPESLGNLTNLSTLGLSDNQLSSLPASFGNLTNLQNLDLSNNKFTFAGLETLVQQPLVIFTYAPQDTFKLTRVGNTLIASVGGTPTNNTFHWYRDNQLDTTIQADSIYTPFKAGNYRVEVVNSIATQLTLYSKTEDYLPAQKVFSFTLINAIGEGELSELKDGDTIHLSALRSCALNIRANTAPDSVGSVLFQLTGAQTLTRTENIAPYALYGNNKGNYYGWRPSAGNYTLTATPYSMKRGTGEQGTPLTVSFTVVAPSTVVLSSAAKEEKRITEVSQKAGECLMAAPNPFSSQTTISFYVPSSGRTVLEVCDVHGRVVDRLYEAQAEGGKRYRVAFNSKQLPSGVYMLRVINGKKVQSHKLVLIR